MKHEVLATAEGQKPKFFYGYVVVAASFLVMLLMWGASYSFGVFFKPLLAEFGWTRAMISGAYSLDMFLTGVLSIGAGRLTDRFGPRAVITSCGLVLGLGYLLISQISALWQLYLLYGVMVGAGMSGAVVPMTATVARWFVKRRGMMTGITVSGLGMGTLVVPPVANWLITSYGWRTSYFIVGMTVLVLTIAAAQFVKRDPGQIGQRPYGESKGGENSLSSAAEGFSLWQAIRTSQLWLICLALFFMGAFLQIVMVHIVPYTTDLQISATGAAIVLAVIGGMGTGGRVSMGIIGDRIGNRLVLTLSFGLVTLALFWLLAAKTLLMLYLFAVIFGFGYGGIAVSVSPAVAEQFGLRSLGIILGVIIFSCAMGETIGPVLAGYIFDVMGSYSIAFLIAAIASLMSLVLILLLKPAKKEG